jgi:hypothetical protein
LAGQRRWIVPGAAIVVGLASYHQFRTRPYISVPTVCLWQRYSDGHCRLGLDLDLMIFPLPQKLSNHKHDMWLSAESACRALALSAAVDDSIFLLSGTVLRNQCRPTVSAPPSSCVYDGDVLGEVDEINEGCSSFVGFDAAVIGRLLPRDLGTYWVSDGSFVGACPTWLRISPGRVEWFYGGRATTLFDTEYVSDDPGCIGHHRRDRYATADIRRMIHTTQSRSEVYDELSAAVADGYADGR